GNIMGEYFSLAPHASVFDGELDLIILSIFKKIDYLYAFFSIFTRQHLQKTSRIEYYKFKKAEISSEPRVNVQIDGDIVLKTPFVVEVIPSAVNVIIPKLKN
ncbi:MAG: diacylglycerol/lipid kinase family protein, partial [bacterium]